MSNSDGLSKPQTLMIQAKINFYIEGWSLGVSPKPEQKLWAEWNKPVVLGDGSCCFW
ncbi:MULTISPECIES: hypothetical protein [Nostocaceae]|uniref:Uncharacterized protein n=1 Tax=Nostoc spongiaeforme FACHB-130 TaxID=1357510 RepID=A0ABR8G4N4_9NOSO|nr:MULTISPECIES: hypothetical protein [Nostocaceae]MBD2479566.1 hypothetical protein [Anabaena sp. FACHB-83]MBD2598139.1 hypothetical protein [Nostoc spongiaeforme FACHB-130]